MNAAAAIRSAMREQRRRDFQEALRRNRAGGVAMVEMDFRSRVLTPK